MRALLGIALALMWTVGLANTPPPACGDVSKIKASIADLSEDYGDVALALNCKKPAKKSVALICADDHLFLMYKLNSMAEVYAIENATKRPIAHKTYQGAVPACTTRGCICAAFIRWTNDSLSGISPYYSDEN